MTKDVIKLLISKGIKVNEEEEKQILEQWDAIELLKKNLHQANLGPTDIGLVNRHGGVQNG